MQRIAAVLLTLAPVAAPHAQGWSGEAALGLLTTSGNSESRSVNGKITLDYVSPRWHNNFVATAINAADEGETTTERYTAADKLDFNLTPRDFVFTALEFEKDMFGGIRERTSETLGYGHRFLLGPVHYLEAELGAGARQAEDQNTREQQDEFIGRAAGRYEWKITDLNSFLQTIKVEHGASNTYTESVSELRLSVIGNLFASVSLTARNNSDVPEGTKTTDLFTAVNLTCAFGKKS